MREITGWIIMFDCIYSTSCSVSIKSDHPESCVTLLPEWTARWLTRSTEHGHTDLCFACHALSVNRGRTILWDVFLSHSSVCLFDWNFRFTRHGQQLWDVKLSPANNQRRGGAHSNTALSHPPQIDECILETVQFGNTAYDLKKKKKFIGTKQV